MSWENREMHSRTKMSEMLQPKLMRTGNYECMPEFTEFPKPQLVRQVADPIAASMYEEMFPEPEELEFDYDVFLAHIALQQAQVGIYDYEGIHDYYDYDLPTLVRQVLEELPDILPPRTL